MATRTPKVDVNPKTITWARESLGYSIRKLEQKLRLKPGTIKSWEDGSSQPSFAQLKKLATSLKRPTTVFLLYVVPQDEPLPKDYRVLDESDVNSLSPNTKMHIRKIQRKRKLALELAKEIGEEIPRFKGRTTLSTDIKSLAKKYRKIFGVELQTQREWQSDYEAFNFWRSCVEAVGVLIFQASLDSLKEMRGLALYHEEMPLIVLNTKDSPRGKIFSLLHEFCHLLLHKSGIGNIDPNWKTRGQFNKIEIYCNAFAAECILPSDEVDLKKIDDPTQLSQISSVANRYRVSWEVILRRLLDKQIISNKKYNEIRTKMRRDFERKAKKKKNQPVNVPVYVKALSYNGEMYTKVVLHGLNRDKINLSDVIDYLDVSYKHLDKIKSEVLSKDKKKNG